VPAEPVFTSTVPATDDIALEPSPAVVEALAPDAEPTALPPEPEPPEGWPPALPWVTDAALTYAHVDVSAAGDVRVWWSAPSADLDAIRTRLLAALVEAAYELPAPCEPASASCSLRRPDRLAALTTSVPYPEADTATVQLHLLPAGHRPRTRLPGECVEPPTRERTIVVSASGFDQDGEFRQARSEWSVRTGPGTDLDGDGVPEVYVPHTSKGRCPWDVPHDVYVMRGRCGHRVGTIVGLPDEQTSTARFVAGLRTITTTAEWAAYDGDFPEPNHHTRTRRYELRGDRLRKLADDEREGICHHCGAVSCRVP
jgi:hypothetical protein